MPGASDDSKDKDGGQPAPGPDGGAAAAAAHGPAEGLRRLAAAGEIVPDPSQERAAARLDVLWRALHDGETPPKESWLRRLVPGRAPKAAANRSPLHAPRGIYLYGEVGRGKSLLLELLHRSAPVRRKRRVHFHAFMAEIHGRLHRARTKGDADQARAPSDLLRSIAAAIAEETRLLCFDEFEVTNIADAMLLGRLFEALLDHGVVIAATSNSAPKDLYRDGLQRELFLPFIALIEARFDVLHLDGAVDYRWRGLKTHGVYHVIEGDGAAAQAELAAEFAALSIGHEPAAICLEVQGRELEVPRAAGSVAWFDFGELCARPLGASDYLAIAERFDIVLISRIPVMGGDMRNEARRFIHLIDVLYENKVKVVCSAGAAPDQLYRHGDSADAFRRTASRLMEMQGEEYLRSAHRRAAASI